MNKQEIIKAIKSGSSPCAPLFLNENTHEWEYVNLNAEKLIQFLDQYPEDKIFPCELSSYKSMLFFILPNGIEY